MNQKSTVMLLFLALITSVGCGVSPDGTTSAEKYAQAIESVLLQAETASNDADKSHSFMSTSKTLKKIRDSYQNIDLRECPADFRNAFLDYIRALEIFVPFSEKYDDVSFYSVFVNTSELITLGPGRLSQVVDEAKGLKESLLAARQVVKETGLRYNADVRKDF